MRLQSLIAAAIALAFAAGSALAQTQSADKPMDSKSSDGKLSKKEAANASRSDTSGFAKLDKNKDGYISKAEAKAQKELATNFDKWDMNNDNRINRAEYLAAMAKHDTGRAVDKVTGSDKDKQSSTGSGAAGSTGSSTSSNAARNDSTTKPKN
jgi:cobalamin biosynthesis Mg chelatase CobN